jgi:hypothetical protein
MKVSVVASVTEDSIVVEARDWIARMKFLPQFLRTADAHRAGEAFRKAGVNDPEDLGTRVNMDAVARAFGDTQEALLAVLRKCPFSFRGPG